MSEPVEGYNHNVAQTKRLAKCRRSGATLESLRPLMAKFKPCEHYTEPSPKQDPISLSRKLTLFANEKLNENVLGMMGAVLEQEQRLANDLYDALSDSNDNSSGAVGDNALHRCAIRKIFNKCVP